MTIVRAGTTDGLHDLMDSSARHFEGRGVTALAREGDQAWALLDGSAILRLDSAGAWREVAAVEGPRARCVLPVAGGLFVGTGEAHLLRLRDDDLEPVDAFDRVDGRDGWYTPWGGPPDTRSLAAGSSGTVFANVHVGGIPRSADGGESWEPTIDVDADVHQVLAHGDRVFAACALGLGVSHDDGVSWTIETDGLHATYCRAVAAAGETVLVTASRGHRGQQACVYRRPLSGATFERCREGLPEWFPDNVDSHCLAAAGSEVALGTTEGDVFLSRDEGESWERIAEALPRVTCLTIL